jgi:hypothetical protein
VCVRLFQKPTFKGVDGWFVGGRCAWIGARPRGWWHRRWAISSQSPSACGGARTQNGSVDCTRQTKKPLDQWFHGKTFWYVCVCVCVLCVYVCVCVRASVCLCLFANLSVYLSVLYMHRTVWVLFLMLITRTVHMFRACSVKCIVDAHPKRKGRVTTTSAQIATTCTVHQEQGHPTPLASNACSYWLCPVPTLECCPQ